MTAAAPVWVEPQLSSAGAGEMIAGSVLDGRRTRSWWALASVSFVLALVFVAALVWSFEIGPGAWGNDASAVWGFPLSNYVFWLGVGHAGTLISSLLWLTRQRWRAAVNRFAETMTLVAVCIAGLFPIVHLGRPMYVLWVSPLPMREGVWPQWRSPLVWDFWAVFSYLLFSLLFFYSGLIPDLATMRDKARSPLVARLYGVFALGWSGAVGQWRLLRASHAVMATVAVPLVASVHSIVGLDFAASLMPAWNNSLYPPYFVVGALFSGFATAVLLGAFLRVALDLRHIILARHFETLARILMAASIVMAISYATEWFSAWRTDGHDELAQLTYGAFGPRAWIYWTMIACNVVAPLALWWPRVRHSIGLVVLVALLVNIGMWFERYQLVTVPLEHTFMPSSWRSFEPTLVDILLTAGSFGFFCFAVMMIARLLPIVSIHGVRKLVSDRESEG